MSAKGSMNRKDWQSVLRHALTVVVADGVTAALDAGLQVIMQGHIDPIASAKRVGYVTLAAVIGGVYRLVQRYRLELGEPPMGPATSMPFPSATANVTIPVPMDAPSVPQER